MQILLKIGDPGMVQREAQMHIPTIELAAVHLSVAFPQQRNRTHCYMRRHALRGEVVDPNKPVREPTEPSKLSIADHVLLLRESGLLPHPSPVHEDRGEWFCTEPVMLAVPISDITANLLRPCYAKAGFGPQHIFHFCDEPIQDRPYWCVCCHRGERGPSELDFAHLRFDAHEDRVSAITEGARPLQNLVWAAAVVPLVIDGRPLSAVEIAQHDYDLRQIVGREAIAEMRYAYEGWPTAWDARVKQVVERHLQDGKELATFYHSVLAIDGSRSVHIFQRDATLPGLAQQLALMGMKFAGLLDSGGSSAIYDLWLESYLNRGWYFREPRGAILVFQLDADQRRPAMEEQNPISETNRPVGKRAGGYPSSVGPQSNHTTMNNQVKPYMSTPLPLVPASELVNLPPLQGIPEIIERLQTYSAQANLELKLNGAISTEKISVLRTLTSALLHAKQLNGELQKHPYFRIRESAGNVATNVDEYLSGKRILVTGAGGAIGKILCRYILQFAPEALSLLDRDGNRLTELFQSLKDTAPRAPIRRLDLDIGRERDVVEAYATRPDVVFHLAGERNPRRAQEKVREAILSNIMGSYHLARLAPECGVARFVSESSGQCRFLYDERVAPTTQRFAEAAVRIAADTSSTRYSVVRIHHVVDNSIVERRFQGQIASNEPLTPHLPPDRRKHGQSVDEAVAMLLNAGLHGRDAEIFGSVHQMDYFSVLDLALFLLKESGKDLPILFKTAEKETGYESREFGGIRLPDDALQLTYAFNTVETVGYRVLRGASLVMSRLPSFGAGEVLKDIHELGVQAGRASVSEDDLKASLRRSGRRFALDVYVRSPLDLVVEALTNGLNADDLSAESPDVHLPILSILMEALSLRADAHFSLKQKVAIRRIAEVLSAFGGSPGTEELFGAMRVLTPRLD